MCRITPASLLAVFVLASAACITSGCATAHRTEPDRTGGIAIDFFIEKADYAAAYYHVQTDGTIGYGGARDARNRKTTWTGDMADKQIDRLQAILKEHDLLADSPQCAHEADAPRYNITIRSNAGRNRIRVQGECPPLEQLHNHLREIAKARFEHIIDTLPRPERP